MEANALMCGYHPTKKAISSCKCCHKPLCSDDISNYHSDKALGLKNSLEVPQYDEKDLTYCPICSVPIKEQAAIQQFVLTLFFIVCAIVTPFVPTGPVIINRAIEGFWLLLVVLLAIIVSVSIVHILTYQREAKEFINSLH